MTIEIWMAFVVVSCALVVIPGPTTLMVISYSLSQGRRSTAPLILAVVLGDSTALVLSLLGLGALISVSTHLFNIFKIVGGMYLIYLGIKLFLTAASNNLANQLHGENTKFSLFCNTYTITALNPKSIMFFVAFLPQFVDTSNSIGLQFILLGCTFITISCVITTSYALFTNTIRKTIESPKKQKVIHFVGAGFLTVSGVWAVMLERPSS